MIDVFQFLALLNLPNNNIYCVYVSIVYADIWCPVDVQLMSSDQ